MARGERWGVIGPNGAGKTTLVRAILDELPLSHGHTKIGYNVVTGYFQQLPPGHDDQLKVFEYLQTVIRRENPSKPLSEQAARNLAGAFLFTGQDQEKPMGALSGGERGRARLAALLACAKNLLVLDEPTNHLDIPSSERLEQALSPSTKGGTYDGALILISHDRALIDSTCDHLLILDGEGGVTVFHGNYTQLQKRKAEIAKSGGSTAGTWAAAPAKAPNRGGGGGGGGGGSGKSSASHSKAAVAEPVAPAANGSGGSKKKGGGGGAAGSGKFSWMPVDKLEGEISKLQGKLKAADEQLASEEVYRDVKKCNALLDEREKAASELAALEEEWLKRAG